MAESKIIPAVVPKILVDGEELLDQFGSPRLMADEMTLALAPDYCSFEATMFFGELGRGGRFLNHPAVDLRGKRVDVLLFDRVCFSGVVSQQEDVPDGTRDSVSGRIRSGTSRIYCWSLDYLLDRVTVDRSIFENYQTSVVFPFNGTRDEPLRNQKGGMFSASESEFWSTADILSYLLDNFSSETGISWGVAGDIECLANITPYLDPSGRTIRDCLNELLSPVSGYSWYARRKPNGGMGEAEIFVVSLSDKRISHIVGLIPKNPRVFSIAEGIETSALCDDIQIRAAENSSYHEIRVTGDPIVVCGTLDFKSALLPDWNKNLESSYNSLITDDTERGEERFSALFRRYRLSDSWNHQSFDGHGMLPVFDEENGTLTMTSGSGPVGFYRLLRTIPEHGDTNSRETFRKPVLFLEDKYTGVRFVSDGSPEKLPVGFSLLDDAPGVMLESAYGHAAALGLFTGNSEFEPLYDPQKMLITVSFRSATLLAMRFKGMALRDGEMKRVKRIHLPGYSMSIITEGTLLDVNTAQGGYCRRDDRLLMKHIGTMAASWYGRLRNIVSYRRRSIEDNFRLGWMLAEVYSGGSFVPSGTVVTRQHFTFEDQAVSYQTDFPSVDFSKIFLSVNRERQNRNVPLRSGAASIPSPGYRGDFAVAKHTDGDGKLMLRIYDSSSPDSGNAGFTDLQIPPVPETFLPFPSGSASVYLVARWTGEAYELEITTSLPASGSEWGYFELARIENGKVYQLYTDGGKVMFSERFFV